MDPSDTEWPGTLRINAWTGERAALGDISPKAEAWALGSKTTPPPGAIPRLVPADDADPADWRHPNVGWGLVLPERPGLSRAELATAADAPEPMQRLVRERNNAPVFRYLVGENRFTLLRNYASGDQDMRGAPLGIGPGRLPFYLLLYGSPEEIPWEFQYILQTRCAVGRLSLTGPALENYVRALLSDWQDTGFAFNHAVVWAVDHSPDDISHLMRTAIAARLDAALQKDTDIASHFLDGKQGLATAQNLQETLAAPAPRPYRHHKPRADRPPDRPARHAAASRPAGRSGVSAAESGRGSGELAAGRSHLVRACLLFGGQRLAHAV